MINKLTITVGLILSSLFCFSQTDTLLPLSINKQLLSEHNKALKGLPSLLRKHQRHNKTAITLPFLDDFSQNYYYPDASKWENNEVFINSNFAIDPISYGVATFDGLDSTGYPYNFSNPISYGAADTLTSKPIDLTAVVDSVFLSFYYQPQGNGNQPEAKDSLLVQFFRKSDSTWVNQWNTPGSPTQPFKLVMLPIDTSFQNNAFQFRFRNYATLSGNVDHWNVDYVYLNQNRNYTDTLFDDVSFITNNFNMLKDFSAMPWDHYKTDTLGLMVKEMPVSYKNNSNIVHAVFYKYQVIDNNGAGPSVEMYPSTSDFKNVNPFSTITEPQAVYSISPFLNDFSFPTDNSENKVFEIKNYFNLGSGTTDSLQRNDTVISYQVFGNYYAYDDGSAELGYGVQGIGSKLAYEFNIKKADTLTALQIYFSPIKDNLSAKSFKLTVWSSLNPETIVYQQSSAYFPTYSFTNQFLNYPLSTPIILNAGTYYFGWEKISPDFLNVGWDVNNNNKTKVHFNAVGVWETSSYNGSLMLRPVFGTTGNPVVNLQDFGKEQKNNFIVYPNPANNVINFKSTTNNPNFKIELIDIYGKIVLKTTSTSNNKLNVNAIADGIYFIKFTTIDNQKSIIKKIIINH